MLPQVSVPDMLSRAHHVRGLQHVSYAAKTEDCQAEATALFSQGSVTHVAKLAQGEICLPLQRYFTSYTMHIQQLLMELNRTVVILSSKSSKTTVQSILSALITKVD